MLTSGFTIAKNITKYCYPFKEAILSILPICDEFVINVGHSEDNTLDIIKSIKDPKIRIVERKWDTSLGMKMLSAETSFALEQCKGTWAFYIQLDEVVHEHDLKLLKKLMLKHRNNYTIDGIRFKWLHFYGSFYRYRIDPPWFQKQVRIIRNNSTIESDGDAWGFRKKDGSDMRLIKTGYYIYHYGWVNNPTIMSSRRKNAEDIGFAKELSSNEKKSQYEFGDLSKFPIYFGKHPRVMQEIVEKHLQSNQDLQKIRNKYFWSPFTWLRPRYKTFLRHKKQIPR